MTTWGPYAFRRLLTGLAALSVAGLVNACSSGGFGSGTNSASSSGGPPGAGSSGDVTPAGSGGLGASGSGAMSASGGGTTLAGSGNPIAGGGGSSGTAIGGSSGSSTASSTSSGGGSSGTGSAASPGATGGAPDGGSSSAGSAPMDSGATVDAHASAGGGHDAAASVATLFDGGVPLDPAMLANCTGTSTITCAINVPNGDYNVTVDLGSATAAATTRVQAELLRIELQPTMTAAGMFLSETFTVNVRTENHGTYSAPGNVLNLLFDGTAPALHGLGVAAAPNAITIFVAGDSTVCDWDPAASNALGPTERGWAQELSQYLKPGVAVANYAVSGQTAGGFYGGYWGPAKALIKAGDYVFVQFGHNDQKNAADIASYQANLTKYIMDAKSKNATPVIFTPVARGTGPNFAGLDGQARTLAMTQNVALIDLTNLAWTYYQSLPDKSVLFVAGQETHFTETGATQVAGLVAQALKTSQLGLAAYIK